MYHTGHLKKTIVVTLMVLLTGCAYFQGENRFIQNRETDYLKARSIQPLKIPPGLSSDTIEARYPVSEKNYPENAKKPSLVPPDLQ